MQRYYAALKEILTHEAAGFLARQADLLGQATDGKLFHVELQSTNDRRIAYRMLNYLVAIERRHGQVPQQSVLYVGEAAMPMPSQG